MDHTLEEVEAKLAEVRDGSSPAFADMLVAVLEQVAALRYIGSQTHPAIQQMVLQHEGRLEQVRRLYATCLQASAYCVTGLGVVDRLYWLEMLLISKDISLVVFVRWPGMPGGAWPAYLLRWCVH